MDNNEAVACDMNSDFQEAFEEKCPHIQPVFDYFHIVKNFNDKVVSEIRKDEQRRLYDEGNFEARAPAETVKVYPHVLKKDPSEEGPGGTGWQGYLQGQRDVLQGRVQAQGGV